MITCPVVWQTSRGQRCVGECVQRFWMVCTHSLNYIRKQTVVHCWRAYQTGSPFFFSYSVSLGVTAQYEVFCLAWLGFNKSWQGFITCSRLNVLPLCQTEVVRVEGEVESSGMQQSYSPHINVFARAPNSPGGTRQWGWLMKWIY